MHKSVFLLIAGLSYAGFQMHSYGEIPKQGFVQETWQGVRGDQIDDLLKSNQYKNQLPPQLKVVPAIQSHQDGESYGSRYTGLITPPEDGEYIFKLAADDTAQLFISPDEKPENLKLVAELKSYSAPMHFRPNGFSQPIKLQKGKYYYIQILHKQGTGGDHIALAWEGPGVKPGIITQEYVKPVVDEKKQKALEASMTKEEKKNELNLALLKSPAPETNKYIEKLSKEDTHLLADKLKEILKSSQTMDMAEKKQLLSPFIPFAEQISASPSNPQKNPIAKQLLYIESDWLNTLSQEELQKLGAHRLSASLGAIDKQASPTVVHQELYSHGNKHSEDFVSSGANALPGVPFTVKIPATLAKQGLSLQVGHHIPARENSDLVSMPFTTKYFNISKEEETFISPHGGIILIKVPKNINLNGDIIQISQTIPTPKFVLEKTSDLEWKTVRNNPAPWGELISEHLTMIIPREVLQQCENPTEVMAWWNENNRRHEDFYGYYPRIPFRMHAALYAREGISYWPLEWDPKNAKGLLDINHLRKHNNALFLHEHGHHTDFGDMEFGYSSESTCNWAGYHMKSQIPFDWKDSHNIHLTKLLDPNNAQHNEIKQPKWYEISNKGTHHWSYPITSMMIGYANDFGWDAIRKTIHRLRDENDDMYQWAFTGKKRDDQAKFDRYLIGLSEEAKRDVRPYFAHFQIMASPGAAEYLDKLNLPKWDLTHLPTPEITSVKSGKTLMIPQPEKTLLSMAGKSSIQWGKPAHGSLSNDENGNVIYTPNEHFTGQDEIPYTVTNPIGTSPTKVIEITVVP